MFRELMLEQVISILNGKTQLQGRELVRSVSIDSRNTQPGALFFALRGHRTDGHEYTAHALERGACAVVVDHRTGNKGEIIVADTLYSLGTLASAYRQACASQGVCTIGVTGTNGKTTVKNAIAAILSMDRQVLSSKKNYNSLIGLPLSLFDLNSDHQFIVLEMGTSRPGEIARLCEIARPDIGVITCIGSGHLQDLGSLTGVREEKLALIRSLPSRGIGFIGEGVGDIRGRNIVQIDQSQVFNIEITEYGSTFTFQGHEFSTPLLGKANVYNCLIALCVTQHIGVTYTTQHAVLRTLQPEPGRLVPFQRDGILFIDDTYNANPVSMRAAIDFAAHINRSRVFILGDMLELGIHAKHMHEEIGTIAQKNCDMLVTLGPLARYYGGKHFTEKGALVHHVLSSLTGDDLILIKASRGLFFEDILDMLLEEL